MSKAAFIFNLAQDLAKQIPQTAGQLPQDVVRNLQDTLQAALQRMEVVTQDDYQRLLARIEKLEALCQEKSKTSQE